MYGNYLIIILIMKDLVAKKWQHIFGEVISNQSNRVKYNRK